MNPLPVSTPKFQSYQPLASQKRPHIKGDDPHFSGAKDTINRAAWNVFKFSAWGFGLGILTTLTGMGMGSLGRASTNSNPVETFAEEHVEKFDDVRLWGATAASATIPIGAASLVTIIHTSGRKKDQK